MGKWLSAALSENGQPSSSRLVSVVGLLVIAPLLLARICPEAQWSGAFEMWCAMVAGVYGAMKLAGAFQKPGSTTTTVGPSTTTTVVDPPTPKETTTPDPKEVQP